MRPAVSIRREAIGSPAARALIEALNAELSERYPEPGANHFSLEANEVADDKGAFLVAYLGSDPVGCGAIRRIEDGVGEIKRMFVRPTARGHGVGAALLYAIEQTARQLGIHRLVLETGERQQEALSLYRRAGFTLIPCFGEYVDSPLSICMGKNL
jgi:putative acetyltransferase